uniref:Rho guanine nucleotide exchange factor 26 isoform X3 n=1 Tax=Geotrypetes seraphini TaxID=260995 RepID=A0A6P8S9T1_GEOSA|nr:rho guanine nucleotide exchange factor 26 isoform X3 [Geotrypetes seraphini]
MDRESEVDFANNHLPIGPLWKRRSTPPPRLGERGHRLGPLRPRPQSYQSPSGVLVTDFPLEDRQAFTVSQPAERIVPSPESRLLAREPFSASSPQLVPNGRVAPERPERLPPHRPAQVPVSSNPGRTSPDLSSRAVTSGRGQVEVTGDAGLSCNGHPHVPGKPSARSSPGSPVSPSASPSPSPEHRPLLPRPLSEPERATDTQPVVLSTNSPAALKVGKQQIIPLGLASAGKATGKGSQSSALGGEPKRALKVRSMLESGASPWAADAEGEPENDLDSPGALRRGLRSTSYRRAVVSGVDFDASSSAKKSHRLSQPVLKAVAEDKFASLVRIKRKMMKGQGAFDGEEAAVLYQNYKEKALEIESDEDTDPKQKLDDKIVVHYKPLRSSWSQLSVVKKNGLSNVVSQEERKRQEAIFEVISSEHSYLLSLEILIRMFKHSKLLSSTMTKTESHHLFSNISDVYEASKKSTNASFKEVLSSIESNEDCRNLPMISFLILPMQRVTRLPLLMDTICQKTPKDSAKYEACKRALKEVSMLVRLCNEGARTMERTEMMYTINSQLEFKIKPFPLVSSSRWLVKRGELTAYVEDSGIFSKRTSKQQVYFFLFNDVLIVTKKKSEDSYNVTDYALKDQLSVEQCDSEEPNSSPGKNSTTALYLRQSATSYLFMLTIHMNHAGEKVEMLLGAETLSERARWITALGQNGDRQSVDRTTLTQVEITRSYTAKQPEELSLQVADVVLVYQKVNDGWYEGERLRDGERGWFPMECAKEITCRATIDKNIERMGRLLGLETNV